jgi:hypothetical protein
VNDSGATDFARNHRWTRGPRWLLVGACVVPLLLALTGCDASTYSPPDPDATLETTTSATTAASTTTTAGPETTIPAVETTTTTLAPVTTTSSITMPTSTTTTVQAVVAPGTVLYEITDWSGDSGWALTAQWKTVSGMLVSDGSQYSFAVAPYDPGDRSDCAVEAEIQVINFSDEFSCDLGARLISGVGFKGGYVNYGGSRMTIYFADKEIAHSDFALDGDWHTYRFEVSGNNMKLLFDGVKVVSAMDNRMLLPGKVGIWCGQAQVNVRAFRVIAL